TVIQDVVNTLVEYTTVLLQETYVQSMVAQVTNTQVQSIAAQADEVYQVTQTYVCAPPPVVTVTNLNVVWYTETITPTVQVYQTQTHPQVIVQPVTVTEQVQQVQMSTQVVYAQVTDVYTTNMNPLVQVVQEDVAQLPPAGIMANAGFAGAADSDNRHY
ncbi:hypothetical protein H4R21_006833, partial [Coemansia helicoidea]